MLSPGDRNGGGTVTINGKPFTYVTSLYETEFRPFGQAVSTCRKASFQVGVAQVPVPDEDVAMMSWNVRSTPRSKDGITSTVLLNPGTVTSASFSLPIGKTWTFGLHGEFHRKYVNGTLNCYKIPVPEAW